MFGTYEGQDLLYLFGTTAYYYCKDHKSEEGRRLWREKCELVGTRCEGDGLNMPSGSYIMDREGDKWVAYRSRDVEWWEPEGESMIKKECELCGDPAFKEVETSDCGVVAMCRGCYDSFSEFLGLNER